MSYFQNDKYKFSTKSLSSVASEEIIEERAVEIEVLKEELLDYKIIIKDLAYDNPSYTTRNKILNIAYFIIEDGELFEYLSNTKKFPINRLLKKMPIDREFIITWREYIIVYFSILSNPKYKYLQSHINIVGRGEISGVDEITEDMEVEEHSGVIIDRGILKTFILTSKGEFIKVKSGKDNRIGEDTIGKEGIRLKKYKLQISILLSLIMLSVVVGVFQYKSVNKTIVIATTSDITLEVNKFNKIVDSYSATKKGTEMLDKLNLNNKDVDTSVKDVLDYVINNEMIPQNDIIITITGKALGYNALPITEAFIQEQQIPVRFNNSGDENKVNS